VSLSLAYESSEGEEHAVGVSQFSGGDLPRSYLQQAKLDFTSQGGAILGGPVRRQRMLWAATAYVTADEAHDLDALYLAWDADRAAGLAAVVAITDNTGPVGTITASAIFTTAPKFSRSGSAWLASFGLTEA
jgi:hypothetical protein